MKASEGILTVRGGMTSHAAVVARGMGTCCVSGCQEIIMDEENKTFTLGDKTFKEFDEISIDGSTGKIYAGLIPKVDASITGEMCIRDRLQKEVMRELKDLLLNLMMRWGLLYLQMK